MGIVHQKIELAKERGLKCETCGIYLYIRQQGTYSDKWWYHPDYKKGDKVDTCNLHHKDKDRENSHPDNLILLCPKCHHHEHRLDRYMNHQYKMRMVGAKDR